MSNETRLKVLLDYLDVLARIKVLDLSCGSGAFLVAAFDFLIAEYERVNRAIADLQGKRRSARAVRPRPADPSGEPVRGRPEPGVGRDHQAEPLAEDCAARQAR